MSITIANLGHPSAAGDGAATRIAALAELAGAPSSPLEVALDAARELLDMDMAYIADTRASQQDYVAITGDGESFGAHVEDSVALEGTYCGELLAGRLDGIVPDAGRDPRVSDLAITGRADIGAYIGQPITLSDGTVFGTLCCLSHARRPGLDERDAQFVGLIARLVAGQLEQQQLAAQRERDRMSTELIRTLSASLAARDGYTGEHSRAVVDLALLVGGALGLSLAQLLEVEQVAVLHDIGKLGIPDSILQKPGPLNESEWATMRTHPVVGADLIGETAALAHLAPAIRGEHERWDGAGYPDGLAGQAIPIASRIVFVCDALHAMTSDRPYRAAMSERDAVAELRRNSGTQFCPAVVDAAVAALAARSVGAFA